jgi:hypothetical protein
MPDSAPLVRKLTTGTAGDQTLGEAPYAGTVSDVSFTPEAAITGDNTNKRTFTLVNKGQAGAGSTVIATLDFVTGVNGVAFDEKQFTLSGTAANLVVASGDILAVVEAVAGTGLANPGGLVQVEITRS